MKNDNESWDVLGDSRKRYRGPWAEIRKYWPGKEPIRLQDSLPCHLKKNSTFYLSEIISIKTEAKWKLGRACFHSYQAADILIENNNNNDNNQLHVFPCDFAPCYSFTWFPKSACYLSPQADIHFLEYQLWDFGVIWQ